VKRHSNLPGTRPNLQYTAGALVQNPDIDRIRLRHRFAARHRSRIPYQVLIYLYPILAYPPLVTTRPKSTILPATSDLSSDEQG